MIPTRASYAAYSVVHALYTQAGACNDLVTTRGSDDAGARLRYLRLLLALRRRCEISQKEMSAIIGTQLRRMGLRKSIAPNAVHRWEASTAPPPDDVIEAYEAITGASRAWIRYGSGAAAAPPLYDESGSVGADGAPDAVPPWESAPVAHSRPAKPPQSAREHRPGKTG